MARTIAHRELRNDSSAVLRDVQSGETLNITNHGEVVAVLMPPDAASGPRSVRVKKAVQRGGFDEIQSLTVDFPIRAALDYLRDDR